VRVEVRDAEGAWRAVAEGRGAFDTRVDLSELFVERYEGELRFSLGRGARLRTFVFDGCVLTAPLALPRLTRGDNALELRTLDRHHLCTTPWAQTVDFRAAADLRGQAVRIENGRAVPYVKGWQQLAPERPGRPVRAAYRFDAPAGRKLAWFYALVSVREGPVNEPPRAALLEWSADGEHWAPFAGLRVPHTHLQWDGSLDGEVLASEAVRSVWLRVTSETALSGCEFHGHLDHGAPPSRPLEITHRWREGDRARVFSPPVGATSYILACGRAPRAHAIEMCAPSLAVCSRRCSARRRAR
jgi:hypothetical protein